MNIFGFLIVTFFLMTFLLRFIEPQPWKSVIGRSLVGSLGLKDSSCFYAGEMAVIVGLR